MLVISRRNQETITIGEHIVVKVLKVRGNVVKIGILAPDGVRIVRTEIIGRDASKGAA